MSHNETQLLIARRREGPGTSDIWRLDLRRGTPEQLTWDRGSEVTPVWIDDERAILYAADRAGGVPHLFRRDFASGAETEVLPPSGHQRAMDVFRDGRVAYGERLAAQANFQLFQLPLTRGASPALLLQSELSVGDMRLSPDGRTMTYIATGGGRVSIYVKPVAVTGTPQLAAAEGVWQGSSPTWSADGSQIDYVSRDDWMMTLPVQTVPSLNVGVSKRLFKLKQPARLLEVSRDGRRLLLLVHQVRAGELPIVVDTAAISSTRR